MSPKFSKFENPSYCEKYLEYNLRNVSLCRLLLCKFCPVFLSLLPQWQHFAKITVIARVVSNVFFQYFHNLGIFSLYPFIVYQKFMIGVRVMPNLFITVLSLKTDNLYVYKFNSVIYPFIYPNIYYFNPPLNSVMAVDGCKTSRVGHKDFNLAIIPSCYNVGVVIKHNGIGVTCF